jgi:large subunit ribosomal protein L21
MFAVIKTGGKQYKVAASDVIEVAAVPGNKGDLVTFEEVVLHGGEDSIVLGSPLVAGASVAGEIVDHKRTAKILVFKKRRRQNSKRSRGHRQDYTVVRITEILTDGRKPERAAAASPAEGEAKPKRAAQKPTEAAATETAAAKPARKPRAKAAPKTEDKE